MPKSHVMHAVGLSLALGVALGMAMSASAGVDTAQDEPPTPLANQQVAQAKAKPSGPEASEAVPTERPGRPYTRDREDRQHRMGEADRPGHPAGSESHGRGQSSPPRELSPEQIQETLEILQEQNPQLARRLREALENQPELARRLLANHWPRLQRLIELKKNNPRLFVLTLQEFRLQREMLETARQLHQAKEPQEQTQLHLKLRGQVQRLFDLRLELKHRELEVLEKRLQELRASIEQAQQEREVRIDRQVEELRQAPRLTRPSQDGSAP